MIKVNKIINLGQLDLEFNGQGLIANLDDKNNITEVGLAECNSGTQEHLIAAIAKHKAIIRDYAAEKAALLTKLGITADEAKLLLS